MFDEQELARRLAAFEAVCFALLFGSRSRGSARPDSDIDVGVFLSPDLTARERWDVRLQLQAALADLGDVDLTALNDAPALLGHRALQGRLIFERDRVAYVRFFIRTLSQAEDERYYRELHRAAREARLREGRFGRP